MNWVTGLSSFVAARIVPKAAITVEKSNGR